MSRNRLKNGHSLHWMGVLKWILIVGLMSILGLVYMLGKNQNLHLAQETYRMQELLEATKLRNEQLNYDFNRMKSPAALVHRLAQMHSTLIGLDQMASSIMPMGGGTRMRLERSETIPSPGSNITLSTTLNPHVASVGAANTPPSAPNP